MTDMVFFFPHVRVVRLFGIVRPFSFVVVLVCDLPLVFDYCNLTRVEYIH